MYINIIWLFYADLLIKNNIIFHMHDEDDYRIGRLIWAVDLFFYIFIVNNDARNLKARVLGPDVHCYAYWKKQKETK